MAFRTKGAAPDEPILKAFKNIQVMNAVLTWDGAPQIARVAGQDTLPNPRRPEWPMAEFIVGNPPFMGGSMLRSRLGDATTEALWRAHRHMNESADLVMYWWDRAAELLSLKGSALRRFGFVTTNSISQVFQRRVMERYIRARSISIVLAIPDHPWTKATTDAAAVRIAMTVAEAGISDGVLRDVTQESGLDTDAPTITFDESRGAINSDLTIGASVTMADELAANEGLCSPGVKLHGAGFLVTAKEARHLGLTKHPGLKKHIRPYRNGRDLSSHSRNLMVIDLLGLAPNDIRQRFPEVYQHIAITVKPDRDANRRDSYRLNWWLFGEPRRELRPALATLPRYIATIETTKHRVFQFLDGSILPDNMLIAIAIDDGFHLGILSSHVHIVWTYAQGGTLEDRPRYTKSRCFDPFPFPAANNIQKHSIRVIADELDAHRRRVLDEHPHLTMTGLYNVLEALRAGTRPDDLDDKHRAIFDDGLVLILKELHERLDATVADAYGWPVDLTDAQILTRLVALNRMRAEEERRGEVRWLRPDYQIPRFAKGVDKQAASEDGAQIVAALGPAAIHKRAFPQRAVEQTAEVFSALAATVGPLDAKSLAAQFRRTRTTEAKIGEVLASLARLGYVTTDDGRSFALRRVA